MVIKVGIIGCGTVLRNYHLPAVRGLLDIEIKALADIKEDCIERTIRKFSLRDVETYNNYLQLLKRADVDATWILTPPETHARIIMDAWNHGKHILCEKPIVMSAGEAGLIEGLLKRDTRGESLILMPAHNFIFTPCFEKAVEYIREGLIGEIKEIYGRAAVSYTHL
ncbi:MAG: Gfo/Idh/MocA family oxidoreductase, partial [Candidatus Bathyarchaeota archaeon]|nr:Gfo/Idh/MocA family oxidoreductase [Candidatus Bathyarchaeota archaeon]